MARALTLALASHDVLAVHRARSARPVFARTFRVRTLCPMATLMAGGFLRPFTVSSHWLATGRQWQA